jgi:glutamate:GABA antiporter
LSVARVATNTEPQLRRELGQWDLIWLSVVAIANLNLVPVFASSGPISLWLLLLSLGVFFWPQGVAVIELSHRYPSEGGIYLWTKRQFGDFHGFLCGWCYWTVNFFYIPTLLFYLVGISLFIGSSPSGSSAENRPLFFFVTLGLLWLIAILNICGLGIGKWVNNLGGLGTFIAAAVFIVLGLLSLARHGSHLPVESLKIERLDWRLISSFGVICFGLIGLELGAVMGDEIRDPRRAIPGGVFWGGLISGLLYLGATLSLLFAVPRHEIVLVQGGMQAISRLTADTGLAWLVSPVAVVMSLSIAGASSAWLAGTARVMFVAGLDSYLPRALGRIHTQHATPYVALIVQAMLISLVVTMGFVGASVREAYLTLLDLAVVLNMIAYLYMYGALVRVAFQTDMTPTYFNKRTLRAAALGGLVTTLVATAVPFVPSRQISSVSLFELKMFTGCAIFLGLGVFFFRFYSRRRNHRDAEAQGRSKIAG